MQGYGIEKLQSFAPNSQYLIQKYSVALTPGLQLIDLKPLKRAELKALAAGLTENRQYFSPLPNVKRELEDIQSEMPSRVLLNQEFTSAALQNRINSQPFPIVHLATHGQFSSSADKTFILAWDKPIKGSAQSAESAGLPTFDVLGAGSALQFDVRCGRE